MRDFTFSIPIDICVCVCVCACVVSSSKAQLMAKKCIINNDHTDNNTFFLFLKALLLVLKDQFGILHCGIHRMI
jgi:hypothetical protein